MIDFSKVPCLKIMGFVKCFGISHVEMEEEVDQTSVNSILFIELKRYKIKIVVQLMLY